MNPCYALIGRLSEDYLGVFGVAHISASLLTLFLSGWVDFPGVTMCQVGIEKSEFGPSKQVIKGAWPQLGLGEMCIIDHMLSVWPSLVLGPNSCAPCSFAEKKGMVTLTMETGTIWHTAVSDCRNLWCQKICKLAICDDRKLYLSNLIGVTTS